MRSALVERARQPPRSVAGADADRRHIALDEPMVEEGRKRARLQNDTHKALATLAERHRQRLGVGRANTAPEHRPITVNNTDVRALVRYIQPDVSLRHGPFSL